MVLRLIFMHHHEYWSFPTKTWESQRSESIDDLDELQLIPSGLVGIPSLANRWSTKSCFCPSSCWSSLLVVGLDGVETCRQLKMQHVHYTTQWHSHGRQPRITFIVKMPSFIINSISIIHHLAANNPIYAAFHRFRLRSLKFFQYV
jgi:hypothetical protein